MCCNDTCQPHIRRYNCWWHITHTFLLYLAWNLSCLFTDEWIPTPLRENRGVTKQWIMTSQVAWPRGGLFSGPRGLTAIVAPSRVDRSPSHWIITLFIVCNVCKKQTEVPMTFVDDFGFAWHLYSCTTLSRRWHLYWQLLTKCCFPAEIHISEKAHNIIICHHPKTRFFRKLANNSAEEVK